MAKVQNKNIIAHNPTTITIEKGVQLNKHGLPDMRYSQVSKNARGVKVMPKSNPTSNPTTKKVGRPKKNPSFVGNANSKHANNLKELSTIEIILFVFLGMFVIAKVGNLTQFFVEQFDYKRDDKGNIIKDSKTKEGILSPEKHPAIVFLVQAIITVVVYFIGIRFGAWSTPVSIGMVVAVIMTVWNNAIHAFTRDEDKDYADDPMMKKVENALDIKMAKHTIDTDNRSIYTAGLTYDAGKRKQIREISMNGISTAYPNEEIEQSIKKIEQRSNNIREQLNGIVSTNNNVVEATKEITRNKGKLIPYQTKSTNYMAGFSYDTLKTRLA